MADATWQEVDRYLCDQLIPEDPVLEAALEASRAAGLPDHNVAPNQGKLLMLIAQTLGARRILEIGTLGGYSTIWLARALPRDGHLDTLEADSNHAAVARGNIARAGLAEQVDLHEGPAAETLEALVSEQTAAYDFIFIDADKPNNPVYLRRSLELARPGTLIIVDNVIRDGKVVDPSDPDPRVEGVRRMNEMLAREPRVDATAIQTVGSKGYDGFALIRVRDR
jgi:predicted O-methyltransferase YrrM